MEQTMINIILVSCAMTKYTLSLMYNRTDNSHNRKIYNKISVTFAFCNP